MLKVHSTAYLPDTKRIEAYLSPDRDLPLRLDGAGSRFVLCTTPRSGSSLIASMLHATGQAGDPLEYLNDQWIDVQSRLDAASVMDFNVARYLGAWETRRTSPNGLFGIKVHYYQMKRAWRGQDSEAARVLENFDNRILLTRRDKIAQAVSLFRAITSQAWTSRDLAPVSVQKPTVRFDPSRIAELMALLIKQEDGWRSFMKTFELPYTEFCYEDFVANYAGQSMCLLDSLGVRINEHAIPPPQLKKQSQERDPMIEQFKLAIGLEPGPIAT